MLLGFLSLLFRSRKIGQPPVCRPIAFSRKARVIAGAAVERSFDPARFGNGADTDARHHELNLLEETRGSGLSVRAWRKRMTREQIAPEESEASATAG